MILLNPWVHHGEYSPEVKLTHYYRPSFWRKDQWRRLLLGEMRLIPALKELANDALALVVKPSIASSELRSSDLVGMQPMFKQTPPRNHVRPRPLEVPVERREWQQHSHPVRRYNDNIIVLIAHLILLSSGSVRHLLLPHPSFTWQCKHLIRVIHVIAEVTCLLADEEQSVGLSGGLFLQAAS